MPTDAGLEAYVIKELRRVFGKAARATVNSGATMEDNDASLSNIAGVSWQFECKHRSKKNIIIEQTHWDHLRQQSNARLREPVMVHQNERGERLASLDFSLFLELLEKIEFLEDQTEVLEKL